MNEKKKEKLFLKPKLNNNQRVYTIILRDKFFGGKNVLLLFLYNYCDYMKISLKNRLLYVIVVNYASPYSPNGLLMFGSGT